MNMTRSYERILYILTCSFIQDVFFSCQSPFLWTVRPFWIIPLDHTSGSSHWTILLDHSRELFLWNISLDHPTVPSRWITSFWITFLCYFFRLSFLTIILNYPFELYLRIIRLDQRWGTCGLLWPLMQMFKSIF